MTGDISRTRLFEQLIQRETTDGFEPGEISNRVREVGATVAPILNQVSRHFPEYTLHDPAHGLRVVENMGKLIPSDTLDNLNGVELSILIYAGYLHDIGMAASEHELAAWLQSEDAATLLAQDEKWSDFIQAAERAGDQTARRRVEDMAFTDYLRLRHAQRGAQFVLDRFGLTAIATTRLLFDRSTTRTSSPKSSLATRRTPPTSRRRTIVATNSCETGR